MKRPALAALLLLALLALAPVRAQEEHEEAGDDEAPAAASCEDVSAWKARALVAEDRAKELEAEAKSKAQKWQEALVRVCRRGRRPQPPLFLRARAPQPT